MHHEYPRHIYDTFNQLKNIYIVSSISLYTISLIIPDIMTFLDIEIYTLAGLILCLRPANERRRYFVTTSLIGWAQA